MHSMHSQRIETGSCQLFELFKYMRETVCTDWPKKKHAESQFLLNINTFKTFQDLQQNKTSQLLEEFLRWNF